MKTPGHPTWMDLGTHDLDGAKAFYSELFGWEFVNQGDEFGGYNMVRKGDGFVAGAMSSHMTPDGMADEPQYPTSWTIYFDVADIDVALAKATELGATVMVPAMEVGDAGRMALVQSPDGAVIGMWQAKEYQGFELDHSDGTPVWFESMSKDFDVATSFYAEVLGWDVQAMPGEGSVRYATNGVNGEGGAGICDASSFLPDEVPSYWRMYLAVPDTDAAVARIQELGGTLLDGPMDSPFGRVATVTDPQGAMFQVIRPSWRE